MKKAHGGRITGPGMGDDDIGPVELSPGEVRCWRCGWRSSGGAESLLIALREHMKSAHAESKRSWWCRFIRCNCHLHTHGRARR